MGGPGSYFPPQVPHASSREAHKTRSKHAPHPPTSPLSEYFAPSSERKSRHSSHRRAKSTSECNDIEATDSYLTCTRLGDVLPLRHSAAQVGRTQLVIYAPSNAEIRIYPALPVRKSTLVEHPVFIDDGAAHVASGVADTPPRFPTRSRCPPPPLVIQKQRKSSRRASTSSAIMTESPSAKDMFLTTPRKTVRFA